MKKGTFDALIISMFGIICSIFILVWYIAVRVDKISNQLDNAYEYLNEYDKQKYSEYLENQSKKLKYAKTYYIPKDAEYPEWIENRQEPEYKETVIDNVFITHYCPCKKCCGKWASGYTADGSKAVSGVTIAAGKSLMNFGDKVEINGHVYTCQDRGVNGKHIDIFCDSHEEALKKGSYYATIKIYK